MIQLLKLNRFAILLFAFISLSCLVSSAAAHTPLTPAEEIHSLDTAFEVPNPTKSWTLYRELHNEGEAEYYKLQLNVGERLRVSIYTKEIDENFAAVNTRLITENAMGWFKNWDPVFRKPNGNETSSNEDSAE